MEQAIKPVFITVMSDKSIRFPNKNMADVQGKPLLQYTIDFVHKLKRQLNFKYYVISDSETIEAYVKSQRIKHLTIPEYSGKRDHNKGMEIMRWIHKQIKSEIYIMLPVTSPARDYEDIFNIIVSCLGDETVRSATTVYKKNRNNYKHNGEMWYYTKEQLRKTDLIDNNTRLFITNNSIDIDTEDDLEKFKKMVESDSEL